MIKTGGMLSICLSGSSVQRGRVVFFFTVSQAVPLLRAASLILQLPCPMSTHTALDKFFRFSCSELYSVICDPYA